MKKIISLAIITCTFISAGMAQDTVTHTSKKDSTHPVGFKATGIVSHKYQGEGCGTVILIVDAKKKDTNIFIPMGATTLGKFDVDGMKISFHYFPLKIRNPKGCFHGGPVRIWDVSEAHHKYHTKKKQAK